ncbi:MAG TPA: hypothetical protein VG347_22315 [Verrucomicrobiae bacterium]|nr:hypothetical protein [Verrucomicrobiae bacterium]
MMQLLAQKLLDLSQQFCCMHAAISAPLLTRVKSWQLVGLGLTGWCTLYSIALLSWGSSSLVVGNAQGGCFAASMALAGVEVKRYKKTAVNVMADPFSGVTAVQLNQMVARAAQKHAFRLEPLHRTEMQMGFGVRVVSAGRTLVFETSRWQEPVIDLVRVRDTEENRKKVFADLAIIVSRGEPDENALAFVVTHPVQFLNGKELEEMLAAEKPAEKPEAVAEGEMVPPAEKAS